MAATVTRKLSEEEWAARLANTVLDRPGIDPDCYLAVLSRQLLRLQERYAPHSMETAPRDGTRILAYLYSDPDDDGYRGFGEWREIWWKPYTSLGMAMPWHAGDPHDSHTHGEAPEHFGEGVPVAWMPIPRRPR
jgi:hypothetical protein